MQNKLQLALPLLPQAVQQQGVRVNKSTADFLMVVGFISEDGRMVSSDLSDYVVTNLQEPLSRVAGVGDIQVFGSQYAMRIWLDPAKLLQFKLVPADVRTAVQAQNAQVSAGQLGGLPAVQGQQLNATITSQSRLQTPQQFGDILLVTRADGSTVRLRASRGSRSVRRPTTPCRGSTARRRRAWRCGWPQAPMRWKRPMPCARGWPSCRPTSRPA